MKIKEISFLLCISLFSSPALSQGPNQPSLAIMEASPIATSLAIGSVPSGDVGQIGRGFSTLGFDWRGICVQYDLKSAKPNNDSPTTNFQLTKIDTVDQLATVLDVSASASMSYGIYSGNVSASYFKKYISNSYSHYIAGRVSVYSSPSILSDVRLNELGEAARKAGLDIFHRTCGTTFAASSVYGGEFLFILEIASRDDQEYESMKADINASVGNFGSGSVNFSQSISKLSSKYKMTATIIRNGLREQLPDLNPDSIEKYSREFPVKITANGGVGMQLLRMGVLKYSTISVGMNTFSDQELFLQDATNRYITYNKSIGEIIYYMSNREQFFRVASEERLLATYSGATRNAEIILDAVIKCSEAPSRNCKLPSTDPVFSMSGIPQRLKWVVLPVSDGRRVSLGTVPPGETRRVRFRGIWRPSGGSTSWVQAGPSDWSVITISVDGKERSVGGNPEEEAKAGERVEVSLNDSYYPDNETSSTGPASATLY